MYLCLFYCMCVCVEWDVAQSRFTCPRQRPRHDEVVRFYLLIEYLICHIVVTCVLLSLAVSDFNHLLITSYSCDMWSVCVWSVCVWSSCKDLSVCGLFVCGPAVRKVIWWCLRGKKLTVITWRVCLLTHPNTSYITSAYSSSECRCLAVCTTACTAQFTLHFVLCCCLRHY